MVEDPRHGPGEIEAHQIVGAGEKSGQAGKIGKPAFLQKPQHQPGHDLWIDGGTLRN